MDCNVVKDLIPLYIDHCCSEESAKIVKEHIEHCTSCREFYKSMNAPAEGASVVSAPKKLRKIDDWKASVLQSVLLFVSFAMITVGVALEAATPVGPMNGYWALSLIIPATGFLLSLANWYFVRLYKSKKSFSNYAFLGTLGITACGYIWAGFHYKTLFVELFSGMSSFHFVDRLQNIIFYYGVGIVLTIVSCAVSKLLSNKYATMLGKE